MLRIVHALHCVCQQFPKCYCGLVRCFSKRIVNSCHALHLSPWSNHGVMYLALHLQAASQAPQHFFSHFIIMASQLVIWLVRKAQKSNNRTIQVNKNKTKRTQNNPSFKKNKNKEGDKDAWTVEWWRSNEQGTAQVKVDQDDNWWRKHGRQSREGDGTEAVIENGDVSLEGIHDQVGEGLSVRLVAGVVLSLAVLKHRSKEH